MVGLYQSRSNPADVLYVSVWWCSKTSKWCIIIYFPFHPSGNLKYRDLLSAFQGRSWEANAEKYDGCLKFFYPYKDVKKTPSPHSTRQLACACLRYHFNLWNAEAHCSIHQMSFRAPGYVFCNCSGNSLIFIMSVFCHHYGGIKPWAKLVWRWLF